MKASDLKNEPYEPKKLEAIYNNLLVHYNNQQPKDYEIKVDDFTVIERNGDPSRFMNYSDYITPESKWITILIYKNNNQSDKFFFHLRPNKYTEAGALSGFGMPETSSTSVLDLKEKLRKELHYEELLRENAELKRELERYEDAIQEIEDEKEKIKANRDLNFERITGILLTGALNSDFVKKNIPALGNLSGTEPEPQQEEKNTASFKRKGEPEQEVETEEAEAKVMDEEEKGYIQFVKDIRARVGDVELANVMHLLDLVTANPHAIHHTIKVVSNYIKQMENQK